MLSLVDFFLHLDKHLNVILDVYGFWTYLLLFAIVFLETGLVVTPFLPGDSLLFAAGAFTARGSFEFGWLLGLLALAAIAGDAVNFWLGYSIGPRVFQSRSRLFKKEYLDRTHEFYERYGGKTIFLARFVPIIRTFAPFVAGVGRMDYRRFALYNVSGGLAWTGFFISAGYYFGNLPLVQNNFSLIIVAIVAVSVLPAALEVVGKFNRVPRKA